MVVVNRWRNWAGNVTAHPKDIVAPRSEAQLAALMRGAAVQSRAVRVVGAGHSFAPLCATPDMLISLENLQGVVDIDDATGEFTVEAGTRICQVGEPLLKRRLALENQGDIDTQAFAGAVSTGTHGTGLKYGNFSSRVSRLRLMLASGDLVTCSASEHPQLFDAARLSLGVLGVITQLTLRAEPAYRLHERSWVAPFEETMAQLDHQVHANDHFEFFWLPQFDASAMKTLNRTEAACLAAPEVDLPPPGTLERYVRPERIDWSYRVFPSVRNVPFLEMEFAVPLPLGPACFREIRALIQDRHPQVTWAVEYRTQRQDNVALSPAFNQDSVTISVHEAPDRPHEAFFRDAQAVFRSFGGRPHWGKLHSLTARDLRPLYPCWDQFQSVREWVDPEGRFLNAHTRTLMLGD